MQKELSIESRVSIGFLEVDFEKAMRLFERKMELLQSTFYFCKANKPTYFLPDSFEECTMERLDKVAKSPNVKKPHDQVDTELKPLLAVYGLKWQTSGDGNVLYTAIFKSLFDKLKRLRSEYHDGKAIIKECTPEWLKVAEMRERRRAEMFNTPEVVEVSQPIKVKEVQSTEEEIKPTKERTRRRAWYILDPKFLDFRFKGSKFIGDPMEGVMMPRGTSLAEAFPDEWRAFPKSRLKDVLDSKAIDALERAKENMEHMTPMIKKKTN